MGRTKRFIFLMLITLPSFWSCAGTKPITPTQTASEPPPAVFTEESTPSIEASVQAARAAKSLMEAGAFQKAIDIYTVAHRNHPNDRELLQDYVQSLEKIKKFADQAFDGEDYVSAGRQYALLIKNNPNHAGTGIDLSFNTADLDEKFSISKKMISRQGFQEYRKGNLSQAIALWQALISFDPDNQDIVRALNTARVQQKNLQH